MKQHFGKLHVYCRRYFPGNTVTIILDNYPPSNLQGVGLGGRKNPRIIVGENYCHFGASYTKVNARKRRQTQTNAKSMNFTPFYATRLRQPKNRLADSRESSQGSRSELLFRELRFGALNSCEPQASRESLECYETSFFFCANCPDLRCESPGHLSISVTQRGAQQRGRKQMRANASKRRQTRTNASKCRGANASKREQT